MSERNGVENITIRAYEAQTAFMTKARGFFKRVFAAPPRAERPSHRRRTMPCELYLTMGWNSVPLFPSGAVDSFCFFQRGGVSAGHDVEYLARLDIADAGSEEYKPYGLFRLDRKQEQPLLNLETCGDLWARLSKRYGLSGLPSAQALASHAFTTFDPRYTGPEAGVNVVVPVVSKKAYLPAAGGRNYSYGELLEILRRELDSPQRIAWLELAFQEPPSAGEIVHRYYLDEQKQAWLVRHHWGQGKSLYKAQTNAEALAFCLASGHFDRESEQRRAA